MLQMQPHAGNKNYMEYEETAEAFLQNLFTTSQGADIKLEFDKFADSLSDFFPRIEFISKNTGLPFLKSLLTENKGHYDLRDFLDEAVNGWCTGFRYLQGMRGLDRAKEDGLLDIKPAAE